jgi:rhodanese-related sulfurtransferase
VLIDLRSKAAYETWHHPQALFLDFPHALRAYPSFDPSRSYVLYCEFGLKSAHLADLMRRAGLVARHVSGGLREVRRWVEAPSR